MKNPDSGRLYLGIKKIRNALRVAVLALFVLAIGTVWASSGEEPGSKGWVETDFFRVLNFAVLAGGLFLLLRKPLAQALGSRIAGIKEQLENLEARRKEGEKKLAEYNEKLSQLEKEAEKIIAEYINQGNEARARILKEAEEAAEKLQVQARRNIEREFEKAKDRLQEEIFENSLTKAQEIITKKITADDQDRLVDEYLGKVVA